MLVGKRKVPGFPQRITTGCAIAAGSPPTASAAAAAPSASLSGVQDAESAVTDAAAAPPVDSLATEQALELHDGGGGGGMTTTRTVVAMNPAADTGNSYDYRDDGDTHLYRIYFMI